MANDTDSTDIQLVIPRHLFVTARHVGVTALRQRSMI